MKILITALRSIAPGMLIQTMSYHTQPTEKSNFYCAWLVAVAVVVVIVVVVAVKMKRLGLC